MKKSAFSVIDLILFALSIAFCASLLSVARPCGIHNDGTFGKCYEVSHVVLALGGVLFCQSFFVLLSSTHGGKEIGAMSMLPLAIVVALTPDYILQLCPDFQMRCQVIMQPVVLAVGGAIALFAFFDACLHRHRRRKEEKEAKINEQNL
ncbi:MAG: DUF4418 family protein [Erysipelotrichaceae bacterium]|nr:DUF4418 family protein [Erysipelotrichaceae bacterium]